MPVSGWAPSHDLGLKLGQALTGRSLTFCSIFSPAHLVSRTNCRLKGLWLGCCSNFSLEVLPASRRCPLQAPYPPLLGSPSSIPGDVIIAKYNYHQRGFTQQRMHTEAETHSHTLSGAGGSCGRRGGRIEGARGFKGPSRKRTESTILAPKGPS